MLIFKEPGQPDSEVKSTMKRGKHLLIYRTREFVLRETNSETSDSESVYHSVPARTVRELCIGCYWKKPMLGAPQILYSPCELQKNTRVFVVFFSLRKSGILVDRVSFERTWKAIPPGKVLSSPISYNADNDESRNEIPTSILILK